MATSRSLRYVESAQVKAANGVELSRAPLSLEGAPRPIGELDGLLIDLGERRVRYFVVQTPTGKRLLPPDETCVNRDTRTLYLLQGPEPDEWEPFDASDVEDYDDEAFMSLLFGPAAA
jgi:hypothetical protein